MTNKEILQADMLDILFEHRNKLYGAYALRRTYSHRLRLALAVALSVVLFFMLISFIKKNNNSNGRRAAGEEFIVREVDMPKQQVEPEKPKELPKPQVAQSDYQKIVVVPDKDAEQIVENNNLIDTEIGDQTIDGEKPDGLAKPTNDSTGNGTATVKEPEKDDKPVLPTRNASFPGGTAAWLDFLRKFLQAPEDIEPGQKIEVYVRFWVGIDGTITNPEIIKSGGKAFDKEVLRVLKKMPRWEPAVQNGNYVATPYTQPVIFIGVEE